MSASAAPLPKPLASGAVHPVDEVLAAPRLIALGIQHVLVMYAGAVAVPLIIGAAIKAPREQVAFLITCDLLACGIASLLQSVGVWRFGIRLPVIMGVTFAAVGPMVAIGSDPSLGLLGIYGATIVAGIFTILMAPFVSRLLPLFPPVVTGTIITVIGISLVGVGINWAAGGVGNPQYGRPLYLGIAFFVLLSILLITRFGRGFVRNISVLLGLIIGTIVAALLGQVDFSRMSDTAWFAVVTPFSYGMPIFDPIACTTMCVVMVVVMIESLGMFLALGEICDRPLDKEDLTRGLRVDGLGTLIGGMLNTFPHSSFSQKCRPCRRHRRAQPLGLRGRRCHPDHSWPDPETGRDRRIGPLFRSWRSWPRDVRDGHRDGNQDPCRREPRRKTEQPADHRDQYRIWHDPDCLAAVLRSASAFPWTAAP